MANKTERLTENVPGPWYVDSTCIDCDLCRELARAAEAKEGCPVEAIGNDGGVAPTNDQSPAT